MAPETAYVPNDVHCPRSGKNARMDATRLGSASITPAGSFGAGSYGAWTVTYVVGDYGIDDGGSVLVCRRAVCDSGMAQTRNPGDDGYTTVSLETNGGAGFRCFYDNRWWIRPWRGSLVVHIRDGSLAPGDKVHVTFGDTSGGSRGFRLQTFPETRHTFKVVVDATGSREYYEVPGTSWITIVPAEPAAVDAVIPSVMRPGDPVPVAIRMMDRFGNPSGQGVHTVRLSPEPPDPPNTPTEPPPARELEFVSGVARWQDFTPPEGACRLRVSAGDLTGSSNPFTVSDDPLPIYWADLHGQTRGTIGTGSVEEYFTFARDKGLLDAAGWQGNDFQITDSLWREVCEQTARFNKPGAFVTFLGYEWSGTTPTGGDHNILYLNDHQPLHRSSHWQVHDGSSEAGDRCPITRLWEEFRGRDDVMAVAHVGGRYANLDFHDPAIVRLVEIHSHHGTFEWLAEDALRRGLRVGIVGQSDDHSGRPGHSAPLDYLAPDLATFDVWGGLTGIYAHDLSRDAIWQALRARHCYATSGRRILLEFAAGAHMMGDVVKAARSPEMSVRVLGTAPILDIEIRKDADVVHRNPFPQDDDTRWVRIQWSGVRIRSRDKRTTWHGTLSVSKGRIEAFLPFAFDRRDEGVQRLTDSSLRITSKTAGDIDGVFLKPGDPDASLTFESDLISRTVALGDITPSPLVFDAGGVNQQLLFARTSPNGRPREVRFAFRPPDNAPGAYWVRVVQVDGHMAWSSPIFLAPCDTR